MTGRSPLRLLAPLALVVTAIVLFAVVTSGGGGDGSASSSGTPQPTVTPTATAGHPKKKAAQIYIVQAGDTPSSIAAAKGIDVKKLLAANPDIDPIGLHVGQKLKLP